MLPYTICHLVLQVPQCHSKIKPEAGLIMQQEKRVLYVCMMTMAAHSTRQL